MANPDPEITPEEALASAKTSSWPRAVPTTPQVNTCSVSRSSSVAPWTSGDGDQRGDEARRAHALAALAKEDVPDR